MRQTRVAKGSKVNKRKPIESEDESSEEELQLKKTRATKASRMSKKKPVESEEESSEEESNMSSDADSDDSGSEEESDDSSERKGKSGFTDENASWLKPKPSKKSQLLSSDDSDDEDEDGDESVNDDDDLLEIERESKLLDKQMEQEKVEAEVEFQRTIAENTAVFHLPTAEELVAEVDGTRVVPPSEIRERINDIIAVLSDFKNRREPNRARSDYITQLTSDLAETFGYLPELVEYFLTMFNPSETLEFLEASDSPRPLVIRTNTLKTRRKDLAASLLKRGVTLDPLATWSKVGLKITASQIPIGATPEYLSGQYMLQSAASFCPVLALNPSPGKELVLDMSAAPGGKTSYIAQLMRNTGIIVANDLKPERQKATVANLHRLGVKNTITCCHDGRKLGKLWKNRFTKILLDAPCSGLGVISRDPSVKIQRTIKDVERCGVLQKELLLNAIDALSIKGKEGGVMVYSTCSVSIAENEEVINYILNKRDVKLINCGLDFGKPGYTRYQKKRFHPSLALTRRFYPHVHNMDGFYVAKIRKLSDKRPEVLDEEIEPGEEVKNDGTSDEEQEEIDWQAEVKSIVSKSERSQVENRDVKDSGSKKLDKRKFEKEGKSGKRRNDDSKHISVPPKRSKSNKKSTNAKVTKPRRQKKAMDEM